MIVLCPNADRAASAAPLCTAVVVANDAVTDYTFCLIAQRSSSAHMNRYTIIAAPAAVGDEPGNYRDQNGRSVHRENGLGDQGLIFRLPDESV